MGPVSQPPAGPEQRRLFKLVFLPEQCGQFEGSDSRGGEAQRVSVGDLLHGSVEALNIVSLQH